MPRSTRAIFLLLFGLSPAASFAATVTPAQRCEADVELASAQYAKCRLTAEAKYSQSLDDDKRASALARCSEKLQLSFAKAVARYGGACTATEPSSAFDAYLRRCSDDAAAAAAGAALPDYVGDLSSCNADLTICNGDLTTRTGDLAICTTDLATCEGDLAACEALPPARLLKTGQTTSYGAGSDGDLQVGVARNFVDNGDGTITDTQTGLMWEKKSDDDSIHDKDNTYTWGMTTPPYTMNGTVVTEFLAPLNAAGGFANYTDWRLPNITELETLRNFASTNPATFSAFDTACSPGCTVLTCSCTKWTGYLDSFYWSSSSTASSAPSAAWVINFDWGYNHAHGKEYPKFARAVRGGS